MAATPTSLTLISFAFLMLAVMGNLCEDYGECGLKGICKLDGDSSNCTCPPGFHFRHPQNTSNGCTQNAHNQQRYRSVLDQHQQQRCNILGVLSGQETTTKTLTQSTKRHVSRNASKIAFAQSSSTQIQSAIAVKKLEYKQGAEVGSQIGEKEFRTEMIVIGSSHHRNLVQLYGFCNEGSNRILVYEYMPNGSLDRVLFQSEKSHFDWDLRVKIILGTARGILYLHEEWGTRIVHCDIKPQNILLDENYSAKLSDLGIVKLMVGSEQTRTFTEARGTVGYMAPEWRKGTAISVKVDVYSFGVMLLEIICCRKMAKLGVPENEIVLSEWAYNCLKFDGGVLRLVENQCTSGINERELERMLLIGLWCVQEDPCL